MYRFATQIIISVLFFTILQVKSYAQDVSQGYTVKHWAVEDGLPNSEIQEIWSTSDGYMWLKTIEGLIRFDGKNFKTFNNGNTRAFQSTVIHSIHSKGTAEFWLKNSFNDEGRFIHYKDNEFFVRTFEAEISVKRKSNLSSYNMTPDGTLWIWATDGLYKSSKEGFEKVFTDQIKDKVFGIFVKEASVWVAVEDGFYRIDDGIASYIAADNIKLQTFTVDDEESIWVQKDQNLTYISDKKTQGYILPNELSEVSDHLDLEAYQPGQLILSSATATYLLEDGVFQKIYGGSSYSTSGVDILSKLKGTRQSGWVKIHNSLFYNGELVTEKLVPTQGRSFRSEIFVDDNGQAWVGTGNGLYQYSKSLFSSYGSENGIDNVYPLFQDHTGTIWTSSIGGVISKISDDEVEVLTIKNEFPRTFSFYEDEEQNIWLGTAHGIRIWNRKTGSFATVESPHEKLTARVSVLTERKTGEIWAGSREGLYTYKIKQEEWEKLPVEGNESIRIALLYQNAKGDTLIGTRRKGLFILKNDTLRAFKDNERLTGINIRSIYKDDEGILWVGPEGGGLNRIELTEDGLSASKISKYNQESGLFGSVIHTILEDDYGRFWMSSNQGISWVDKAQLNDFASGKIDRISPVIYLEEDGLPGNEANGAAQNSGLTAENGSFWFAMRYGITNIHPDNINELAFSFPTRIESVVNNDSLLALNNDDQLNLTKEQRDIDFVYTAFNYQVKAGDIHFSYKLEGYDNKWIYAGNERIASYSNIPPGEYTFSIKAGIGSQWDEAHISTVRITIEPYFYETSWFFGFLIGIGAFVLMGLIIWGNRKLNLQRKQHELSVKEQEEALSEHDTFLKELQTYIEPRIKQPTITAIELSSAMNVSERQLYRLVKTTTGFTPQQFVREIRLKKARQILEAKQVGTIAEVAYSVGFSTPFYFSKIFEERFEFHPNELIK